MKRYHGPLLSFIVRQTDIEPEDIYQETWLRIVKNAKLYDTTRKFSTWLFQIAINLCRDAHRRRAVRGEVVSLDYADRSSVPETGTDVEELREGIARLPLRDREILNLRYYLGFKESEVARILGIPIGTVKGRTHRAVKRLKELVNPQNGKQETI
jgi:RNA polymerase sigma-70 factor (ECF subfamily)